MEKVIYLIMVRQKDSFNIIYAGDCEHTSDNAFFTENPNFECWVKQSGSEKSLYLAIFPMFESGNDERKKIIDRVITRYNPLCNVTIDHKTPDYKIRQKQNSQNLPSEKTLCRTIIK